MAVCDISKSKVVSSLMQLGVSMRDQKAASKPTKSPLEELGWGQRFAMGFAGVDNVATAHPQLRPFVDQLHIGEKIRSVMAHNYNPVLREVANLSDADSRSLMKVAEALNAGMKRIDNADGTISVKAIYDLVGMKAGETATLNPKLTKLFNDTRMVLDDIYDNVIRSTKAYLGHNPDIETSKMPKEDAGIIKLLEDSRRENYFPQIRSGRYAVEYYDSAALDKAIASTKDPETRNHLLEMKKKYGGFKVLEGFEGKLDTSKLVPRFQSSRSRAGDRAAEMEKKGMKNVIIRDLQTEQDLYDMYQPDINSLSAVDALFQSIMVPNKQAAYETTKKVIERLRAQAEYGRQGRLRRRKDVPGWLREDNYDTYFRSTLPGYVFTMSDYVANKATEVGRREAINGITNQQLKIYAEDTEKYLHADDSLTAKLKNFTFLYTIGGNLSSALVQPTQLLHTSWPLLSAIGGTGNAAIQLSSAAGRILGSFKATMDPSDIVNIEKLNLPADEKQLLRDMFQLGIAEPLLTRDQAPALLARSQDPNLYALGRNVGKVMDAFTLAFAAAETVNRLATGLATYRMMKDPKAFGRLKAMAENTGATINTPMDAVTWAVAETQFTMSKPFRAANMRGMAGGLSMQFMPFAFKMLGFQRRAMEYYGGKGILSLDAGKKVMGLHLLGLFATAGIWGLPFAAPLGDLLDKLMKEVGPELGMTPVALKAELREALQAVIKEVPGLNMVGTPAEVADYFFNGPFRATGIDISKRTALDIIPENVLNFDFLNMGPFMSAVVGGAQDAVTYHKKGMDWMAIASLLPVSIRNLARSQVMQEVGFITPGKIEPTLPAKEMQDPLRVLTVATGFTPTEVARTREAKQEIKDLGEKMDSLRQSYSDRIATLLTQYYNTRNPSYKLEAQNLADEIAERDKGKAARDRIVVDATTFNNGIAKKIEAYMVGARNIKGVPEVVRGEFGKRLEELKQ